VRVCSPGGDNTPFFEAVLTPARFVPSLPVPRWLPLPTLVQPPIPPPADPASMLIGCPEWIEISLSSGGWSRLTWPQPALASTDGASENGKKRYGDGERFPNCNIAGYAFEIPSFTGVFSVGKVLSAEDAKTK
jgi:hypothetical protein